MIRKQSWEDVGKKLPKKNVQIQSPRGRNGLGMFQTQKESQCSCGFSDKADTDRDDVREVGSTRTHRAQIAPCVNELGFFF